MLSITHQYYSF